MARSTDMADARRDFPLAPIDERDNIIIFGTGLNANNEVYISAHGKLDDHQQYTAPLQLNYYCDHGERLTFHMRNLRANNRPVPKANNLNIAANVAGHDYVLKKYQGAGRSADSFMGYTETYSTIARQVVAHPDITVVTIRDRWNAGSIRLSAAVRAIRVAIPTVQVIHCMFCRETPTTPDEGGHVACRGACQACG